MRAMILGMVAGLSLAGAVWAQERLTPNPQIEGTIQSQIDAFLRDDFVTAFTFASPSIRGMFGTPENFGAMVRNGYPMVWRPKDVQFGPLRTMDGALWQQVLVQDDGGNSFVVEYQMVQVDGVWRIAGVQVIPAPDVSA
jgi:hypothetical protein